MHQYVNGRFKNVITTKTYVILNRSSPNKLYLPIKVFQYVVK